MLRSVCHSALLLLLLTPAGCVGSPLLTDAAVGDAGAGSDSGTPGAGDTGAGSDSGTPDAGPALDDCRGFAPSARPVVSVMPPAAAGGTGSVSFAFESDVALPESYFAASAVVHTASGSSLPPSDDEVGALTASGRTVTVTIDDWAAGLARGSLVVTIELPDPRDHGLCSHPGMRDRYFLALTITFDPATGATSTELEADMILGAI